MYKITKHPILEIPAPEKSTFTFEGHQITGDKGFTIAAALHQAGHPVHSHSLTNRERASNAASANAVHAKCSSTARSGGSVSPVLMV